MIQHGIGHSFHIPVMGTGYTIDTPVKVAHLGISSVISIVDDVLIEKMREFYCRNLDISFEAISNRIEDFRAKRITAYLNLIDDIVKNRFDEFKALMCEKEIELEKYFELLPDFSQLKNRFRDFMNNNTLKEDLKNWINKNLAPGSIDVNIMTKVDKENYSNKYIKLTNFYNDAHAALRGFARSKLRSSVVLSAGMNPRLYSYLEEFKDFYPNEEGHLKKKVTIKVSDYRSALIQGKFLAKKGIWVSEYRVESGLNCGGHAFATNGYLLGPILEEFKRLRKELIDSVHGLFSEALKFKGYKVPENPPPVKITAQGGVGTSEEHNFLLHQYAIDSVGWGSPFLLVPEVINIDDHTLSLLEKAREDDLYLSKVSPLGVPFNNLRGNSKDLEKVRIAAQGNPGSTCPKKLLVSNREYTERPICTASRQYQKLKIKALNESMTSDGSLGDKFDNIVEKVCLCLGLASSVMIKNRMLKKGDDPGVSICPGPNIAYFSKKSTLKDMVDHIYGRLNLIKRDDRPNLFVKELRQYVNYLKTLIEDMKFLPDEHEIKKVQSFHNNLLGGIGYYKELFLKHINKNSGIRSSDLDELDIIERELSEMTIESVV